MNNKEIIKDKKTLASLEAEYKRTLRVIYSIRALVTDLNFEELIPDSQERCLMVDELQAYDYIRTNLMNRIRFYRNRLKANKPEPWEENEAVRTVDTPCGPVRVVDTDKASKEELGEMIHHCGQDAEEEAHVSLNELLGMQVICVGGSAMKCEGCSWDCGNCVKVELAGGDYLCLAKPEQDKQPAISFDDDNGNVMDDIKEKTEDFLNYLESIFKTEE